MLNAHSAHNAHNAHMLVVDNRHSCAAVAVTMLSVIFYDQTYTCRFFWYSTIPMNKTMATSTHRPNIIKPTARPTATVKYHKTKDIF